MLRNVHLHGTLADVAKFKEAQFNVDTPLALFCALRSQVKPFRKYCDDNKLFVVLTEGDKSQLLSNDEFGFSFGKTTDIHLVPAAEGAGFEWAAIGSAITSGAYASAAYMIAVNIAIAVVVGAVIQALTPMPKLGGEASRPEEKESFMFNGEANVEEQGYAVPVVYGIHRTGSRVVSFGTSTEDIAYTVEQIETAPGVIPRDVPAVPWQ